IVVRVSRELLAPLIERPIDEVLSVDEVILGVRAVGDAQVRARPQLVLKDDPDLAAFTVLLEGSIESQTIGRKGPVDIYSRSQTRFTTAKRVCFRPGRGFVQEPALIESQTSSNTEQIIPDRRGPLGRVVERIAWRRVDESRDEVNQIVKERAEAKIGEAFDRLLARRLARANWLAARLAVVGSLAVSVEPTCACCTRGGYLQIAESAGDGEASFPPETLEGNGECGLVQIWWRGGLAAQQTARFLGQVDQTRRALRLAMPVHMLAAHPPPAPASSSYGVVASGDWFVLHWGSGPLSDTSPSANPQRVADVRLAP